MTSTNFSIQREPDVEGGAITAAAKFIPDGLNGLDSDLATLRKPPAVLEGKPLEIDLNLIAEDPNQPR